MAKNVEVSETPAKPAGKSKLNLVLIALLLLMTATTGFLVWRHFTESPARAGSAAPAREEAPAADASESTGDEKAGSGGHGSESAIINFEPFLVNMADRDAFRYLRVTIRVQVTNKAAAERIASTDVFSSQIRDAILGILAVKVSDQVITSEGKEQLKGEIAERLNSFLPGKPVKAVFFTDFVVQL